VESFAPPKTGDKWMKSVGSGVKSITASAGAKELCRRTV